MTIALGTHEARTYDHRVGEEEGVDYKNVAVLEFKKRSMEQPVENLCLKKDLSAARHRLGNASCGITWTRQTNEFGLYYN